MSLRSHGARSSVPLSVQAEPGLGWSVRVKFDRGDVNTVNSSSTERTNTRPEFLFAPMFDHHNLSDLLTILSLLLLVSSAANVLLFLFLVFFFFFFFVLLFSLLLFFFLGSGLPFRLAIFPGTSHSLSASVWPMRTLHSAQKHHDHPLCGTAALGLIYLCGTKTLRSFTE